MGNVGLSAEDLCQQGTQYMGQIGASCEDVTVHCVEAQQSCQVRSCRLRHGERRWVPESLYRTSLVIGSDFAQCWGCVELACILYGAGGTVIAAVGSRALSRADGVSLDLVNGTEALNLCLARLSSSVHGLLVVCMPSTFKLHEQRLQQLQENDLNQDPGVIRGTTFLTTANSCSEDTSIILARHKALPAVTLTGDHKIFEDNSILQNSVCTFDMEVPARSQNAAVVLLALHCGLHCGDPWEIEAVGRKVQFPPTADSSSLPLVRTFSPIVVQLANRAAKFFGSERIGQLSLLEQLALEHQLFIDTPTQDFHTDVPRNGKNADAVAAANRLAGQKRYEAETERRRATVHRQSIMTSQEQLRRLLLGLQHMQYGLEAWRREALLSARQGNAEHVVQMLDRLSTCLVLDDIESHSVVAFVKPSETQCTLRTESTADECDMVPQQPSWPMSRDISQQPSWTTGSQREESNTGNSHVDPPSRDPHLDLHCRILPGGAGDALAAVSKPQVIQVPPARFMSALALTPPRGQHRTLAAKTRSVDPPASRSAPAMQGDSPVDDGKSGGVIHF